ncbi:MAG: reverse transcriptase domain-containing protein, partial [Pseudomonadota bacterium]
MDAIDFLSVRDMHDIHLAAEWIEKQIQGCIQGAFPYRTVTMSDRDPEWMTPKVKWLLNKRKRIKRGNNLHHVTNIEQQIQSIKIQKIKKNARQWWKTIDRITHRKEDNNRIQEDKFEPYELNLLLATQTPYKSMDTMSDVPAALLTNDEVPQLTLWEVAMTLRKCKNTSPGPFDIPAFVYREFWDVLAPAYKILWNRSIAEGNFPKCYKRANVKLLPKVQNAEKVEDLRGISITPIISRLFERVVHRKWIAPKLLHNGDILQFAYKSNRSTIDCLLTLQHTVLSQLDERNTDGVHAVVIDLSKAFDRVDYTKAVQDYEKLLNCPYILKWLQDFSVERTQRVTWKDVPLPFIQTTGGCPQGTVGGPAIFSMYTDDNRTLTEDCCLF